MPTWDVTFDLHVSLTDEAIIRGVARAEALAQIVRGIPMPPSVYAKIDRLNIIRAVRGTTGIEGADLSEAEVERILANPQALVLGEARAREEKEARNAARVMEFVAETLRAEPEQPVTESLICELHHLTTEGIEYPNNTPGFYRAHAVHALDYVPPRSSEEVRRLMSQFVEWLNNPPVTSWPQVVRAIAAHFYFISIHPFGDGNGRTARSLESYLLYQAKVNAVGFYSLSNFYYRNRAEYVEMLDYVRFRSRRDLTPFVRFALQGLVEELELVRTEVLDAVTRIVFHNYASEVLTLNKKIRRPGAERMLHFLAHLREQASLADIRAGRHVLSVLYANLSSKTLDRDIQLLERERLIERINGSIRLNLAVMQQFTR